MIIKYVFTVSFILLSVLLFGQTMSYTLFKGKVYKYPNKRKYIKYEEDYADKYPLLNEIVWDSIHVDQRDVDDGFPGVSREGAFGIMFNTVLTVDETSMYRFAITSDDGSLLWVNDELIIDNDFSDGMHLKADTIALRPGNHDIRLWYYQAYPTMFGFIFDSEPVSGEVHFEADSIMLDEDLLFAIGSSKLQSSGYPLLDSLSTILMEYEQADVSIVGHTDDDGDHASNQKLSEHRAMTIRDYLLKKMDHTGVRYITKGRGETQPIASNDTYEGRAKNRRVEILVEGY